MRSPSASLFAAYSLIAAVNADFYILKSVVTIPPNCVGEAGCTPVPADTSIQVIGTNDFNDCDALLKLSGGGRTNGFNDPVCPADGKPGTNPFNAPGSACGMTKKDFFFRVQAENSGQLDAATDSDFNNIVANCYKAPNCGIFGAKTCSGPSTFTALFQCGPLNGSGC